MDDDARNERRRQRLHWLKFHLQRVLELTEGVDDTVELRDLQHVWRNQHGQCAITNLKMTTVGRGCHYDVRLVRRDPNFAFDRSNLLLVCRFVQRLLDDQFSSDSPEYWYWSDIVQALRPTVTIQQGESTTTAAKDNQ